MFSPNGLQLLPIVQLPKDYFIFQDVVLQDDLEQPLIHGHHFSCRQNNTACLRLVCHKAKTFWLDNTLHHAYSFRSWITLAFKVQHFTHTWDDHCYQLKREKESKCAQMVGDLLVNALLTGASKVYSAFGLIAAERPNSDTMSPKVDWEVPNSSITCLA